MQLETVNHKVEFCVIGGGLSGLCAAVAAARHGVKTLIMQERPMFGGNASSEVRMWVCGAVKCLETGIIEELRLENRYRNPNSNYSIWDSVLYEKARFQENLTCLLNCSCLSVECDGNRIKSVTGHQQTTQQYHKVEADYFSDCSGDSVLAHLAGAVYRIGREEKTEFNETLAQNAPDKKTMGLSCILQAREYDRPQKFIPPVWANKYHTEESFPKRGHKLDYMQNFWWLELGGEQDTIRDTESLRDELLKEAYGIWDHIKNHGDHAADNWAIDWVGILPGKRESRRCIGDYILNEQDVLSGGKFEDTVAYGGWPIDDHHPGGFRHYGTANTNIVPEQPYGIPLRCLYSKNIENLFFAGRNISATHTALSSSRVMATCSVIGQAVGTTVACAVKHGSISPRETAQKYVSEIQQMLLDDDCFLPGVKRVQPELSANSKLSGTAESIESLRSGIDREFAGVANCAVCRVGDVISYTADDAQDISVVRIVFDSDLSRNPHNMRANYRIEDEPFAPPPTLVKSYSIICDGKEVYREDNNYQRFNRVPLSGVKGKTVSLQINSTWGKDQVKVFAFDIA